MILRRLKPIHKNQRGFTLVELVIAIAISGLITGSITMAIFQILKINTISGNQMLVVRQVQNAGYWISRDVQMAESMVTTGVSSFPITLTWTEWGGAGHTIIYSIVGSELFRTYDTEPQMRVAQYIDTANTGAGLSGGSAFSLPDANAGTEDQFTLTDAVGGDSGTISVATPGDVVKATPYGGATVAGGTDPVTINTGSGNVAWATAVVGSYIVVTSNATSSSGSWTSTTGTATATLNRDNNGDATLTGNSARIAFTITAKLGIGLQEASETRTYEVTQRLSS